MNYWIGQGFGICSTITDISLPLFKKKMADAGGKHRRQHLSPFKSGIPWADWLRNFPISGGYGARYSESHPYLKGNTT